MSSANKERLLQTFLELTAIDSLSFKERAMADKVKEYLEEMGLSVSEDDTKGRTGSDTGNLFVRIYDESRKDEPAVLFSAHLDTVAPGLSKKAVVHDDGRITSDGTTILGADDLTAVAEIIEAVRQIREEGGSFRNIELLFTVAEEHFKADRRAVFCLLGEMATSIVVTLLLPELGLLFIAISYLDLVGRFSTLYYFGVYALVAVAYWLGQDMGFLAVVATLLIVIYYQHYRVIGWYQAANQENALAESRLKSDIEHNNLAHKDELKQSRLRHENELLE